MWFVLKAIIATFVVLFFLQIKVGQETIEQKAHIWIQTSPLAEYVRSMTDGGIKIVADGFKTMSNKISSQFKGSQAGNRLNLNFSRSKEYLSEKKKSAEKKIEQWREDGDSD